MSRIRKITGAVTNDARFFSAAGSKKGENHELREELRSPQRDRKKDAVKKVIANMTVGKDVSTLFTDVINCIQTDNLELKKLVYLYLINYAKTQPDLALLAVNTFVKDANDSNPLIRALAIRTMGCIRVEKITEYLCEPLARCLRDDDPYVRKTAAVCVAKLYNISPELVEERGFLESLRDLIGDPNPTVVSNAISALSEISEISGKDALLITTNILSKLLAALNECTEWGQVFILDILSLYNAQDTREAEGIIERILPRLQHNNSAVVMSAIKVILHFLNELEVKFNGATNSADFIRNILKKLSPPLITLLNSEPEIQYVALRNINLIIMKRNKILENEIKVFFCKYNDPIYVKMEKLEIIIKLINEKNIEQVLLELKEYSMEVDVDFVKKSIKAIGRCAIKLEKATEKCISVLLDLIKTKVSYIIQECIVVIKDIFRKYPNKYEGIIANLCENLEDLDEPEAKASMVWIIGEYAERIDNADELLDSFLETFNEETAVVQLQLLTATVKLFLKQPADSQDMMQKILNLATEHSDNPDLRDRGYIYWRLLSSDPEAARAVVLATKPEINDDTAIIEENLLEELLSQLSTLSSIYHKPADSFIIKTLQDSQEEEEYEDEDEDEGGVYSSNTPSAAPTAASSAPVSLLDMDDYLSTPTPAAAPAAAATTDFFGSAPAAAAATAKLTNYVKPEQGKGVSLSAGLFKKNNQIFVDLEFTNSTPTPMTGFAIQFNKNIFGFSPQNPNIALSSPISNGSSCLYTLPLIISSNLMNPQDTNLILQTAVKNLTTNDIFYFNLPIDWNLLLNNSPNLYSISSTISSPLDVQTFANQWKSLGENSEVSIILKDLNILLNITELKNLFSNNFMPLIFDREITERSERSLFFLGSLENFLISSSSSGGSSNGPLILIELKLKTGQSLCKVSIRSVGKAYAEQAKIGISRLLV